MATILLIDESTDHRDMLARRLKWSGHNVLLAANGDQAAEMTEAESPDVVVVDLNVPVLDNWCRSRDNAAKTFARHIPIIALSDHNTPAERQRAFHKSSDAHDTKPVDYGRLLGKIESVLRTNEARPAPSPQPSPAATPAADGQAGAGRVLVVDDMAEILEITARWLKHKDFEVDTADSGKRALEKLAGETYDAVLLDVMMPLMSGLDVLRELRKKFAPSQLPVIMVTALDGTNDIVQALKLGANDYLTKPFDFPVLMARVGTHISLKRTFERVCRLEQKLEVRNEELNTANLCMQDDLAAAARVQAALLPTSEPQASGYHFAWLFKPCADLAGDILNVFNLDEKHIGAYVLDVSGHGVAAALLSVSVSRFLTPNPDPSSLLWHRINEHKPQPTVSPRQGKYQIEPPRRVADRLSLRFPFDNVTRQYFTLCYAILDVETHTLRYVSAGHPDLIHLSQSGEARVLDGSGFPIGVGPDPYEDHAIQLQPGDRIFIHTDGINEAMNPAGELFGASRLIDVLRDGRHDPLDLVLRHLSERLRDFTGSPDQRDDQTALAIERRVE